VLRDLVGERLFELLADFFQIFLTLAGASTSSPITMFMGMAGASVPWPALLLALGWRVVSANRPRARKAVSMDSETIACFFLSACDEA
jgi:hypothetical protein